jgi:hypothetical protein
MASRDSRPPRAGHVSGGEDGRVRTESGPSCSKFQNKPFFPLPFCAGTAIASHHAFYRRSCTECLRSIHNCCLYCVCVDRRIRPLFPTGTVRGYPIKEHTSVRSYSPLNSSYRNKSASRRRLSGLRVFRYSVKGRPHYYSSKKEEYAHIKFDLDAGEKSLAVLLRGKAGQQS